MKNKIKICFATTATLLAQFNLSAETRTFECTPQDALEIPVTYKLTMEVKDGLWKNSASIVRMTDVLQDNPFFYINDFSMPFCTTNTESFNDEHSVDAVLVCFGVIQLLPDDTFPNDDSAIKFGYKNAHTYTTKDSVHLLIELVTTASIFQGAFDFICK